MGIGARWYAVLDFWSSTVFSVDSLFGKVKDAARSAGANASTAQEKVLDEYLPKIVALMREKAGPAVVEVLSDPERLAELSRSAYQVLPMPVRLVVREQGFVDWVLSHQDKVVETLSSQLALEGVSEDAPGALPPADE